MTKTGKVSHGFFESKIAPKLGANREDVMIGPAYGVDFGVIKIGKYRILAATDPISILPELGWKQAGRFAISFVFADIAVSGIAPTHLSISFALPDTIKDAEFAQLWAGIHDECQSLDISVITGHTSRYAESQFPWVGSATAMAVTDQQHLIRPDGANPGDTVLITRGPAIETTGLLTTVFPNQIPVDDRTLKTAQQLLDETAVVDDALTAATAGNITAMHDVTEGGIYGALCELSLANNVGLDIETASIPVRPVVQEISSALEFDPWLATSAGSLLICVDPADTDAVLTTLEDANIPIGVAGTVTDKEEVVIDGTAISPPSVDSSWGVYNRLRST